MSILGKKKLPTPPVKDFDKGFGMDGLEGIEGAPMPPMPPRPPAQRSFDILDEGPIEMGRDFGPPQKKRPEFNDFNDTRSERAGPARQQSPPLFIKIDRYREVVEDVQKLRSTSMGLRDAIDALSDIEKEMQSAIVMVGKAISKLSAGVSTLESKFSRVAATDMDIDMPSTHTDIEANVQHLYDQMERIKKDLKDL